MNVKTLTSDQNRRYSAFQKCHVISCALVGRGVRLRSAVAAESSACGRVNVVTRGRSDLDPRSKTVFFLVYICVFNGIKLKPRSTVLSVAMLSVIP